MPSLHRDYTPRLRNRVNTQNQQQTTLTKEDYEQTFSKKVKVIDSHLHPDMTFNNFVVGNCNRMAQNAALLVSTNPGKNFNPLFIYSHPGLGKTHLLNAIGNHAKEVNPAIVPYYITSKDFVDEIINAMKTNKTEEVYNYYKNNKEFLVRYMDRENFNIEKEQEEKNDNKDEKETIDDLPNEGKKYL